MTEAPQLEQREPREESRRALAYVALFSLLTVVPGLSLLVRGSTRASGGAANVLRRGPGPGASSAT